MKPLASRTAALALSLLAAPALFAQAPATKPAEVAPAAKPFTLTDPVAVVEGAEIKKVDLDQAFAGVLASQGMPPDQASQIPEAQRLQFYRMLLDDMIVDKLVAKRSAETKVDDAEIAAQLAKVQKNFGSEEEMKKQIEASGQNLDKVKDNIRNQLRAQHWIDDQVKGTDTVADAEAEEFYKTNPDKFKRPEQVRASHILLSVTADAKPEDVVKKEKEAQDLLTRVKGGEDFAKVAAEKSEDPSAKQNSGDLDFFGREQMVKEFSDAAFAMKKDEISKEPVRSQFGYHIIKVTDRREAETIPLDTAKAQVLAFLQRQKKQKAVQDFVKDLREKAEVKVNFPELPATPPAPAPPAAGK
jgi:peptidyl-prolyl cis-trans isomerase C